MGEDAALKPKVSLVVGHTMDKPGAFAGPPINMHEYEFNTALAQLLASTLANDYEVRIFFRDNVTIPQCYSYVDAWKPELSIELHFNSSADPQAKGTEVLCTSRSRTFAKVMQDNLVICFGREGKQNRGIKILMDAMDRGFTSVSQLNCPNILLEPFFGSNAEECSLAMVKLEEIPRAIKTAVDYYLTLS